MFQRKMRRFRRRPNGRNNISRNPQSRLRPGQFDNIQPRNSFRTSMSAEKSFEKYSSLAKEAMSAGDKTLSENYLQHAEHFTRLTVKPINNNDVKSDQINKIPEKTENTVE